MRFFVSIPLSVYILLALLAIASGAVVIYVSVFILAIYLLFTAPRMFISLNVLFGGIALLRNYWQIAIPVLLLAVVVYLLLKPKTRASNQVLSLSEALEPPNEKSTDAAP